MTKLFARFLTEESGATAIEYGLIAALISVALIAGAGALGNSLNNQFNTLSTKLNVT
jgi:pilus assembly protein Flp/PilA